MPPDAAPRARQLPVQEFKPTHGTAVGYLGLAACAGLLALVIFDEHSAFGLRAGLAAAFVAALIWAVMLRPRATAYADTLVLRGSIRDVHLPLASIEEAVVRHVLVVFLGGDERYRCTGIGRSSRAMLGRRSQGPMAFLGIDQDDDRLGGGRPGDLGTSGDYPTFVENRIHELAQAARRSGGEPRPVRWQWAWPELVALVLLGSAFGISLLV